MKKLRQKDPDNTIVISKVKIDPNTSSEIQALLIKTASNHSKIGLLVFFAMVLLGCYLLMCEQLQLTQDIDVVIQEHLNIKMVNATPASILWVFGLVVLFLTRFDFSHVEKK